MKKSKNMMYTNSAGVSYYKHGKKYYSNSGWLEREITKADYDKALIQMGVKEWKHLKWKTLMIIMTNSIIN